MSPENPETENPEMENPEVENPEILTVVAYNERIFYATCLL